MFNGNLAIDYLQTNLTKDDHLSSSHWKKLHSGFEFSGSKFSRLIGFGEFRKPYGLLLWYASVLQRPFRNFGRPYSKF